MKIRFIPLETVFHPETHAMLFERLTMYNSMYIRETMSDNGVDILKMSVICGNTDEDLSVAYAQVIREHCGLTT